MSVQKIPMTSEGAAKLRAELDHLKTHERLKIITAISEARAHGDLKENAEYHASKEKQSFIEGRIQELENKLALSDIIDVKQLPNNGKVVFGATFHLMDAKNKEKLVYQIVGEDESDIKQRKLSVLSPIARAAIGKETGGIITVRTPVGLCEFEITKVEYI